MLFFVVNALVRWANVHYHLDLAQSAAERFKDAGQIAPRLALWKYGWTMFKTHPLLGVGWGEFPRYQFDYVSTLGGVEIANNSHDIFLDLLGKTGLIGLAIVLLGLVAWLVRVVRAPHTRRARVRHRADRRAGDACAGRVSAAIHVLPAAGDVRVRPAGDAAVAAACRAACRSACYAVVVFGGLAALYPVCRDYNRAEVLYYGARPAEQYRRRIRRSCSARGASTGWRRCCR